ncbi:MAG: hypothetical protein ABW046_11455 [Actinoplanes sp.]
MTTMYETSDLRKRVERYEAALDELRAAHQDVRSVLVDQVLYDRWQQMGVELGFVGGVDGLPQAGSPPPAPGHELHSLNQPIPQMLDAWAS